MKRLKILAIIVCVVLLFVSAAVIVNPAGPPAGLDVSIIESIPLPVNVENDVMTIDPIPLPVEVQSGATISVDNQYERMIVRDYGYFQDSTAETATMSYTDPTDGKDLVIETISLEVDFSVQELNGGSFGPFWSPVYTSFTVSPDFGLYLVLESQSGIRDYYMSGIRVKTKYWASSYSGRIYVRDGETISASLRRSNEDTLGWWGGRFSFSGYSIDSNSQSLAP